jgi:hypothetical protein
VKVGHDRLRPFHASQPVHGADPKNTPLVFVKALDDIVWKTLTGSVSSELTVMVTLQTAARTDPKIAQMIFQYREDLVVTKPGGCVMDSDSAILQRKQAGGISTNPQRAVPRLAQRIDLLAGQGRGSLLVQYGEMHSIEPRQSLLSTEPQITVMGLNDGSDGARG